MLRSLRSGFARRLSWARPPSRGAPRPRRGAAVVLAPRRGSHAPPFVSGVRLLPLGRASSSLRSSGARPRGPRSLRYPPSPRGPSLRFWLRQTGGASPRGFAAPLSSAALRAASLRGTAANAADPRPPLLFGRRVSSADPPTFVAHQLRTSVQVQSLPEQPPTETPLRIAQAIFARIVAAVWVAFCAFRRPNLPSTGSVCFGCQLVAQLGCWFVLLVVPWHFFVVFV